jgi:hypothetical protein
MGLGLAFAGSGCLATVAAGGVWAVVVIAA